MNKQQLAVNIYADMADARLNENNIDEFGRYGRLNVSVSPVLAKAYFQRREGTTLSGPKVRMRLDGLLLRLILKGEIE